MLDNLELPFRCNMDVLAGCQRYASEVGWDCVINPFADRALGSKRAGDSFDGVLAHATPPLVTAARRARVPVVNVTVNSPEDSPVRELPAVLPDCEAAGVMAARHLVGRGFRQFGFLGFARNAFSRRQRNGFHAELEREGFPCTDHRFGLVSHIANAAGWEAFIAGLEAWVETWTLPMGIYVTEDLPCRYLVDLCQSKGLHVPQDVAMVGSHDEVVICTSSSPTLTSINHNYLNIGYRAAALLDGLMNGKKAPPEPEVVPPAELIPRQSTDSFAVDDPLVSRALRFISEHGHESIPVTKVAAALATTRRTLERRFRESLDRSVGEEITRMRLERAKRRLVETSTLMKDVAASSGFSDADHFYKVFTRIEGISPTRFREERRKTFPEAEIASP
jgi:LacI family transcriptional regulator